MRGKGYTTAAENEENRITPAYAGKRVTFMFTLKIEKDHPRLCGEKGKNIMNKINVEGSPPPMRGKAGVRRNFRGKVRITPAYAGKSSGLP